MLVVRRWLLAISLLLPGHVVGQELGTSPWDLTAFGGLSQHLSQDRLHSAIGFGLGLRRHVGSRSGLSLEATYLPLGAVSESGPYFSILQPGLQGTLSTYQARKILRLALGLDLPLTSGAIRPAFLIGLGSARLYGERRSAITDTAGAPVSATRFAGWSSGWTAHLGLGVSLPTLGPVRPSVEGRLYGFAVKDEEEGWSALPVLTLGLSLTY